MKKKGIALLSALMLATAFGGIATFNASAAVEDVPEALTSSNIAAGKEVTFRDLADVNTQLTMYNYYPNGGGIDGSGCYAMDGEEVGFRGGNHITDGESNDWSGYKVNATAANTAGWAYLDMGAEYTVDKVKVHMLAAWTFSNVIVQVSSDPKFEEDVTTIFSCCESLTVGDKVVYNGGMVGVNENIALTGYNNGGKVNSMQVEGNTFMANGATGRYIRVTNNNTGNGGADSNTTISELEVYVVENGVCAPKASVASGSYKNMTTVELTSTYDNAEIYYTLDGSYPTKNSTKYEGPIDASAWSGAVALRAIAVVNGKSSAAVDYAYKITVPSVNKASGKMASFRSLTDMNEEVAYGSYYPDSQGFYGDMFDGNSLASLTDGVVAWGSGQNRSTQAANTHAWIFLDLEEEVEIDNIQVGYLAAWCFNDVVIQVSNDPTFATGVTTIFACEPTAVYADDGTTVIYDGGQVGCSEETRAQTGWNGNHGVDSSNGGLRVYDANGVKARYVRLTNNDGQNGGAQNVTTILELQVWSKGGASFADPEMKDTVKSIDAVASEMSATPGTTLEEVKAMLPAKVGYTTMAGASGEVALAWESSDWADMTVGTFTFTATPVVAVDDVFEVVPANYTVKVTVAKADTSKLEAVLAEVGALDGGNYTAKTWNPLKAIVAEAEEAVKDITIKEDTIAKYIEAITEAKNALKELAKDKTALAAAIATASAMDKANYMSATVEGFDEALATATAVNNDTDASVEEATKALNGLNAVLNAMVEKGDTTALAGLVAEIKAANYVAENFTAMSFATLEDAMANAEAILAAAETPKTEVEAAYTALAAAKDGLVAYGDSTELAALVETCEALAEADYTAGSYAAMVAKMDAASALLTEKVMQDVIDAAKAELQTAKDGLVSVVALKAAIASTIDETIYTAITVQVWKDAKAEAQLVLDNANATAEEVAAAVVAIEEAAAGLTEKPAEVPPVDSDEPTSEPSEEPSSEPSSEPSEENSSTAPTTSSDATTDDFGCMSVVGTVSAAITLAGAAALVLLKKKED